MKLSTVPLNKLPLYSFSTVMVMRTEFVPVCATTHRASVLSDEDNAPKTSVDDSMIRSLTLQEKHHPITHLASW